MGNTHRMVNGDSLHHGSYRNEKASQLLLLYIEMFDEASEYEWFYNRNLSLDPEELNPRPTEWLIEHNFNRPQQSRAYLTPVRHIEKEPARIRGPVLPMWSPSTRY
jgi:hypothetical protein